MPGDPQSLQPTAANPKSLAAAFDATELVGHFRLARARLEAPAGWKELECAGWYLVHHSHLPVIPIIASGNRIGWILGYPVTAAGRLLETEWLLESAGLRWAELERALYAMGGRFVAVLLHEDGGRLYLDPHCSMGVVYCSAEATVASNPFLIPNLSDLPYRTELTETLGIAHRYTFFPFGLSPWVSVNWLVPNHFLDLDGFRPVRHWPEGEFEVGEVEELVVEITAGLKKNISAIVETGPAQMSLTAGQDSRVLLACARPWLDHITFVTAAHPDRSGRVDVNVARHIAKRMGLNHRVLQSKVAGPEDLSRWFYRTGFMVGEPRGRSQVLTYAQMDPAHPYLMGFSGELGRAGHWQEGDHESSPITVETLLSRKGIPGVHEILERAQQWLDDLPTSNALTILDLFYLEQAWAGWHGFLVYGHPDAGRFHFYPFVHRKIYESMLRLPTEYRRDQQLSRDIIGSAWPELLEFPINDASAGAYGAYRRLRRFAKQLLVAVRR